MARIPTEIGRPLRQTVSSKHKRSQGVSEMTERKSFAKENKKTLDDSVESWWT
jgi:hypothetical protein